MTTSQNCKLCKDKKYSKCFSKEATKILREYATAKKPTKAEQIADQALREAKSKGWHFVHCIMCGEKYARVIHKNGKKQLKYCHVCETKAFQICPTCYVFRNDK